MGKKGKKKSKKSKAQLEEEARLAEEEARRLEEERLKKEEEERILREQEEAKRKAEEAERLRKENERLNKEGEEFGDYTQNNASVGRKHYEHIEQHGQWTRFVSCNTLPDPRVKSQIMDYIRSIEQESIDGFETAFKVCRRNRKIISEIVELEANARERHDKEIADVYHGYSERLKAISASHLDKACAYVLQYPERHLNDKNEMQLCTSDDHINCGIWVNVGKNPRVKTIEMQDIQIFAEIPKSLALASVAIRVQQIPQDMSVDYVGANNLKPVCGTISFDLITLPPSSKKIKNWTIRHVTPLSTNISRLQYPIPPAGADPTLLRTNSENIPPIKLSFVLKKHVLYKEKKPIVGWWDAENKQWSEEGISEVTLVELEDGSKKISFQTTYLTTLALLQKSTIEFPYIEWNLRPLGERGSNRAIMSLTTATGSNLDFEIGEGYVKLCQADDEIFKGLLNEEMNPRILLSRFRERGMNLIPYNEDMDSLESQVKDEEVEKRSCQDIASIISSFLVASSRWNKEAGTNTCLVRISEVQDFGRTMPNDVNRIFTKEKKEPPRNVWVAYIEKKGVTFVDAPDSLEQYPGLPDPADGPSVYGEFHYNLLSLMMENTSEGIAGTHEAYIHTASKESISLCRNNSPVFNTTVAAFLFSLRVFSCS